MELDLTPSHEPVQLPYDADARPVADIGIGAREFLDNIRRGDSEDEKRAIGRIAHGAGEKQVAARVGFANEAQVLFSVRRPPGDKAFDDLVLQDEVLHGTLPRRIDCTPARGELVEPRGVCMKR